MGTTTTTTTTTKAAAGQYVVQVSAGASGPVEARAFAVRLAEHVALVCCARGLALIEGVARSAGDPPRSVELVVQGDAPARLAELLGTHALLARSDTRGRAARKRWFVRVAVYPWRDESAGHALDPRELAVTAVRGAAGPGGQHVNKVATAVRVRHVPTGIVVRCSEERSQRSNLRRARERIEAQLLARGAAAARDAGAEKRAGHARIERGGGVAVCTWREGRKGALEPTERGVERVSHAQ